MKYIWATILIGLLSVCVIGNERLSAQTLKPLWTKMMPGAYEGQFAKSAGPDFFAPRFFFGGKNNLVWYQFGENPEVIGRRELPLSGASHYMFRVITVSLQNPNAVEESQVATGAYSAWSVRPDPGTLLPTAGGILLLTGGTIRFLSENAGRVLKQVLWSDVRDDAIGIVSVKVSRDGKKVIADFDSKLLSVEREYDGETFQLVGQWVHATEHSVQLNTRDWYWDRHSRYSENIENEVEGRSPTLSKNDVMLGAQISTDHSVGAAIVVTVKGEIKSLDIPGHYTNSRAIVFDNEVGRIIGSFPFACKKNEVYRIQLSPDGNWMALLNGRELSVYEIHR